MTNIVSVTNILLGKRVLYVPRISTIYTSFKKFYSTARQYENIKTDIIGTKKNVGLIQFNRPKVLNALCNALLKELGQALEGFNADENIAAIIITGDEKAFAAGADLKELQDYTYSHNVRTNYSMDNISKQADQKPIIAAVNGYSLGAGCELAMLCDIIYAGEKAKFGLPEVTIGTISGAGGSQRLPRYVSKSKAMEFILTGNLIDANEAERMGLVSKVFPVEKLLEETIKLAEKIGTHSPLIVKLAKQAVNQAYETTLHSGLQYEKLAFYGTFAIEDRKEGMTAFIEKRDPSFKNN